MKRLLVLLLLGAAAWALVRYVPDEVKQRALASLGLDTFFRETLPVYLRKKLTIPESPENKRKKLLNELAATITDVERELEAAVPPQTNGTPPPLPKQTELRERAERARESLLKSEELVKQLNEVNAGQGVFTRAAERLLGKILPAPPAPAAGEGIGGEAIGGGACRCAVP